MILDVFGCFALQPKIFWHLASTKNRSLGSCPALSCAIPSVIGRKSPFRGSTEAGFAEGLLDAPTLGECGQNKDNWPGMGHGEYIMG